MNGMDINELKKLIKNSTSVLVLDNGEPSFVILGYQTYKDMVSERGEKEIAIKQVSNTPGQSVFNGRSTHEKEAEILERLNKEILAIKSQIDMEERGLDNQHID